MAKLRLGQGGLDAPAEVAFNLFAPEVRQDPYPYYKRLRRNFPVYNMRPAGFWVVTRYNDVRYVLGHPHLFSSSVMVNADKTLLGADPPEHTRARSVISRGFTSSKIAGLEGHIRSIASGLISRITSRKEFDVISDFAMPLPMLLVAKMLGLETHRLDELKRWSEAVVVAGTGAMSSRLQPEIGRSIEEFNAFFARIIRERQMDPGDDIISTLLHSNTTDEVLSPDQVLSISKLLLIAGNETTTNLIGNAVLALLRNPDELSKITTDPTLVPALVEETLRYDAPVQFVNRRATRDVDMSDTTIPAGALVMAVLGSANRDERKFKDPDRFDIQRNPRDHFGFGYGIHFCLGAPLARLEARIALEALLPLLPRLRAAQQLDQIALIDSVQLRGPKHLRLSAQSG